MVARAILLALLFVMSWILYLDRAAISTAKDLVAGDLSLSNQAMGIVFGAFALGYALAQVPSGWFADRVGPRLALATVVTGWSIFTAITGLARGFPSLVLIRFVFGVAEAGAFPGAARAFYSWLPPAQHGRANGLIFSGSRLGAALSFPVLAWILTAFGWRGAFLFLGVPGVLWALIWLAWFRDRPPWEVPHAPAAVGESRLREVFRSRPMLLAMGQYFASNFTFFICLSWMHPYLMAHYRLTRERAAWFSMLVLLIGATAQWTSGFLVDRLYRTRHQAHSRRIPAMTGFLLSALALATIPLTVSPEAGVACFALATFGAEMTISPSWAFSIDLGGKKSGAVSGAMNMVGNFGSFVSASVFPLMERSTGDASAYFLVAAALNVAAAVIWLRMRAERRPS
ncbi:MAG: MFS transporter [Acidobacteria bacterium]|nr:MFS transporter [Acidobacteriota bacterium]